MPRLNCARRVGRCRARTAAARWDRRLVRAAVLLLIVGVGMNVSLTLVGSRSPELRASHVVHDRTQESLVETAIVVAEATDAETGRRFARQMAALSGRELTDQETAAIDAAATRRTRITIMRIWPTKRFWKRLAIGAAIVVALALIANGFMAWWVEHQLQAKIAAIRAAGDPASIADLRRSRSPPTRTPPRSCSNLAPARRVSKEHSQIFDRTPLGKAYDTASRSWRAADARADRSHPRNPRQVPRHRRRLGRCRRVRPIRFHGRLFTRQPAIPGAVLFSIGPRIRTPARFLFGGSRYSLQTDNPKQRQNAASNCCALPVCMIESRC